MRRRSAGTGRSGSGQPAVLTLYFDNKMTLKHFVITRFCLRDRWLQRRAVLRGMMDPLVFCTVDLRLRLLEMLCLPGLRAQTSQDFTWVLLIDHDLGKAARRRLRDMTRGMKCVRFLECRADAPPKWKHLGWLEPLLEDRPDYVITTVNDDDDALPRRYVETIQSHARDLAVQYRLPPFKLAGAKRIVQWDMVFTSDAQLGWTEPWRGTVSVASSGFSLLCRYPAFDFSVLGLKHEYAEQYGDILRPASKHVGLVWKRFLLAARDARVGHVLTGRDFFFDASRDAGTVLMSNHGGNCQTWRLRRSPQEDVSARRVQGAATFPDVSIDWRAVQRHRRHFQFSRVRARLLDCQPHEPGAPGVTP